MGLILGAAHWMCAQSCLTLCGKFFTTSAAWEARAFCGFGQMYSDTWLPWRHHAKYFQCPKILHSTPGDPFLPSNSRQPLAFVLFPYPFPECHRVGIKLYVTFSHRLLPLSTMHLRFLYVFSWLDSSFFFLALNYIPLSELTTVYPFTDQRHLSGFQVLAAMNKAAINIHVDGPRRYRFKWSDSDRERQISHAITYL